MRGRRSTCRFAREHVRSFPVPLMAARGPEGCCGLWNQGTFGFPEKKMDIIVLRAAFEKLSITTLGYPPHPGFHQQNDSTHLWTKCSKVTNSSNFHRSYRFFNCRSITKFQCWTIAVKNIPEFRPQVNSRQFQTEKLIRNPCGKKGLYSSTKVDSHSPSKATKNYLLIHG